MLKIMLRDVIGTVMLIERVVSFHLSIGSDRAFLRRIGGEEYLCLGWFIAMIE